MGVKKDFAGGVAKSGHLTPSSHTYRKRDFLLRGRIKVLHLPHFTTSFSPSSLTLTKGSSSSLVVVVSPGSTQISRVKFSSSRPLLANVSPATSGGPSYTTTVFGIDLGTAVITGEAYFASSGGEILGCRTNAAVRVTTAGAWFQSGGGDVHTQGVVTSALPSTVPTGQRYFSLDLDGYPGFVSYGNTASFGNGQVSSHGWLARSLLNLGFNYEVFKQKLVNVEMGKFDCANPQVPSRDGFYQAASLSGGICRLNFPPGLDFGKKKVVIFVDGGLALGAPLNLDSEHGGFLAFLVKGNISLADQIDSLKGVYLSQGMFSTGSGNTPLVGRGIFIADGFSLGRDLGAENAFSPAELFIFDPNLVFNLPRSFWVGKMSWREIAP